MTDLLLRLRALLFSRQLDEELDEELRFHVEMQTRKNAAAGLPPDAATRQARLQFGGVEYAREECRDARGIHFITTLWRDLRYALRGFRRTPGFTATALLAFALGIGANAAIFSVVYGVLLAPLPYRNPDQLVMVWSKVNGGRNVVSAGDYLDWKRQDSVFQDLIAQSDSDFNLSTSGRPEVLHARIVSPGFFNVQGIPLLLGRDFLPEEGEPGRDHEVIITHRLWQQRFGADSHILGKQLRLNGEAYTVVGVLAAGMADRFESHLFVPLAFKPAQIVHDVHWLFIIGRLKPGVTIQQANADMDAVTRRLAAIYPASNKGWAASVESLHNDFTSPDVIKGLWLLMGAVGFVLLIACVNVANLLLARGTVRHKEVALRASLGASRSQLFSQFLTESIALALIGGALGVSLAWAMLKGILAILPPFSIPTEADVRLSLAVLLFSFAATLLAGVLCGCVPAWHSSRWNLSEILKEGGRSDSGIGRHRLRGSLVVIEFALALTLVGGAGLALHSFWKLTRVNLGFQKDHILVFGLAQPPNRFSRQEQIVNFYRQLLDKLQALPGVYSASVSLGMPLSGAPGLPFSIAGKSAADPASSTSIRFVMVTPDYFRTFGIQIIKGRVFTESDVAGALPVAIVNEAFAIKYLSHVDPLTQRLLVPRLIPGEMKFGPPVEWHIVGVYRDIHNDRARGEAFDEIDVPFWQSPWPDVTVQVRTVGDPAGMTDTIAAVVQSLDSDVGIGRVSTMHQILNESLGDERFATVFLATFACMALLLAAIGIYGVMSFAVAQQTHDIGLRMALGADSAQVLRKTLKYGLTLAALGMVVGLGATYFVGRIMKSILYQVTSTDPVSIVAVVAVLLLCAVAACYIPARRAARVDPVIALRSE